MCRNMKLNRVRGPESPQRPGAAVLVSMAARRSGSYPVTITALLGSPHLSAADTEGSREPVASQRRHLRAGTTNSWQGRFWEEGKKWIRFHQQE